MQVPPDSTGKVLLEVKNLTVTLDRSPIVRDLSFNVADGEFLTILGPNGSGKTVLVKALVGLLPYSGELNWHKKPRIGYLPQGLNQMSVRDMPLTVKDFFALKKLRPEDVLTHVSQVGLEESVLHTPRMCFACQDAGTSATAFPGTC
jgi:zinc transport system ATP-binding protein